jgi:hypothetical protein
VFLVVVAVIAIKTFGPISTPTFRDANGLPVANSIAVVERWRVNGIDESVILRGRDLSNPVLIWLHGGPGSSETPLLRVMNGTLEDHFTVVYWDQRLAGQTLDPLAPYPESLTVAQMVDDLDVVVDRVRKRLGHDKGCSRRPFLGHDAGSLIFDVSRQKLSGLSQSCCAPETGDLPSWQIPFDVRLALFLTLRKTKSIHGVSASDVRKQREKALVRRRDFFRDVTACACLKSVVPRSR